jgi:anti-anti-sigma regulatory factor
MEITTSHQSGVTVLSLNGRLDGLTSPVLEKAVDERLAANEAKIVFDCASSVSGRLYQALKWVRHIKLCALFA